MYKKPKKLPPYSGTLLLEYANEQGFEIPSYDKENRRNEYGLSFNEWLVSGNSKLRDVQYVFDKMNDERWNVFVEKTKKTFEHYKFLVDILTKEE